VLISGFDILIMTTESSEI